MADQNTELKAAVAQAVKETLREYSESTPTPEAPQSTVTHKTANNRLYAYMVAGAMTFLLSNLGKNPPENLWAWVMLGIGLVGSLALVYRTFLDQSLTDAAKNAQLQATANGNTDPTSQIQAATGETSPNGVS